MTKGSLVHFGDEGDDKLLVDVIEDGSDDDYKMFNICNSMQKVGRNSKYKNINFGYKKQEKLMSHQMSIKKSKCIKRYLARFSFAKSQLGKT